MAREVAVGVICLVSVSGCVSAGGGGSTGAAEEDDSSVDVGAGFGSSCDDGSVATTAVAVGTDIGTVATTDSDAGSDAAAVVFSMPWRKL